MYAVIISGGKQFRVVEGQTLKVAKMTAEVGSAIDLDKVLMFVNGDEIKVGTPFLEDKVAASIVSHGRHKKILIVKFKRRKHHRKQMGHRQDYTEIKITKIG